MLKALIKNTVQDLDKSGVVTVAANAFGNVDSDGDISMPGSFTKTLKENMSRMRWLKNHQRDQLLGVVLSGHETSEHLVMRGQINMKKQLGMDTYADYLLFAENNLSLEHSIGVDAVKFLEDRDNEVRKVLEWKMWEYSTLDTWGANSNTPALDIKAIDILPMVGMLELKLKKGKYSDERFIEIDNCLSHLKSLLTLREVKEQPVPADALAGLSADFLKTLA